MNRLKAFVFIPLVAVSVIVDARRTFCWYEAEGKHPLTRYG